MPIISVRIPQLGEGLQEALLVEFLKQPGDVIKRDDPIYVMETDKATTDVESPYDGTLIEWTVEPGSVLEIGTEIAKMEVAEGVKEMPVGHGPADATSTGSHSGSASSSSGGAATGTATRPAARSKPKSGVQIPPKTRKLLKEHGLLDVADQIPYTGSKLMPDDVLAFVAAGGAPPSPTDSDEEFEAIPLPMSQITLNYRLARGTQNCIPVTVMNEIDWSRIQAARDAVRDSGGPTGFAICCWCVVQSLSRFDAFRSTLTADGKTRNVFRHVNLGVAVALPGDEMVTAVVRHADAMGRDEFFQALAERIAQARDGVDQADESTTLTVSNIGKAGMKIGIPAIVSPAVATLAIGETYPRPLPDGDSVRFVPSVIATLSFDHRLANGVGAANFLNDIRQEIESFSWEE